MRLGHGTGGCLGRPFLFFRASPNSPHCGPKANSPKNPDEFGYDAHTQKRIRGRRLGRGSGNQE